MCVVGALVGDFGWVRWICMVGAFWVVGVLCGFLPDSDFVVFGGF